MVSAPAAPADASNRRRDKAAPLRFITMSLFHALFFARQCLNRLTAVRRWRDGYVTPFVDDVV
jgi:hypothetical protein